jgi:hypothetical protein
MDSIGSPNIVMRKENVTLLTFRISRKKKVCDEAKDSV